MRRLEHMAFGSENKVDLTTVLKEAFGCTEGDARRTIQRGEVTIDGKVTELLLHRAADLRGKELAIAGTSKAVVLS